MPLIYLLNMLHCPVCTSTEIWEVAGGCTGRIYLCKHCGYRGALVVDYDDGPLDRRDAR
jgi:hypothetical protein